MALKVCPGCGVHIKVTRSFTGAACPFCATPVGVVPADSSPKLRILGRLSLGTGFAVASLFSATMLTACDEVEPEPEPDVGWPAPVYGVPADANWGEPDGSADVVEDSTPTLPPYGVPPDLDVGISEPDGD